jgi:hypothetical protein
VGWAVGWAAKRPRGGRVGEGWAVAGAQRCCICNRAIRDDVRAGDRYYVRAGRSHMGLQASHIWGCRRVTYGVAGEPHMGLQAIHTSQWSMSVCWSSTTRCHHCSFMSAQRALARRFRISLFARRALDLSTC